MSTRHQRGQIFKAHGAFHVRYYTTVDGVRKRVSYRLCPINRDTGHGSATAKAVCKLAEDFMRAANTGEAAIIEFQIEQLKKRLDELKNLSTSQQVVRFWDTTYLPFIKANLKLSTVGRYMQVWEQHLKVHFGNTALNEYRTGTATKFLTSLARTLGPGTLDNIKNLARGLFAHAVAIDEAEANPWRDAKVLGKTLPKRETEAYTLEEMQAILNALVADVDLQLIMSLAFFSGLRKGEIAALRWEDVKEDHLLVCQNVYDGVVGSLKGKKKLKKLPLIAPVALLFRLWRGQTASQLWVFAGPHDNPIDLRYVAKRRIRPALKQAGLRWKGYHAGRRGLGTTLKELTGNSNAGRDMLGHTDDAVTQKHYEKEMPEEVLKGMKLLEAKVTEVKS